MSKKSTAKSHKKSKSHPYNHFQYAAIVLYLFLSLFRISNRTLLLACGALTAVLIIWMNRYPVRVSGLGLATHTYLLLGGLAALFRITPLLLLYGTFQDAFLFMMIVFMYIVISVKAKKIIKPKLLVGSLVVAVALFLIPGIVSTALALLCFLLIAFGEVKKLW